MQITKNEFCSIYGEEVGEIVSKLYDFESNNSGRHLWQYRKSSSIPYSMSWCWSTKPAEYQWAKYHEKYDTVPSTIAKISALFLNFILLSF